MTWASHSCTQCLAVFCNVRQSWATGGGGHVGPDPAPSPTPQPTPMGNRSFANGGSIAPQAFANRAGCWMPGACPHMKVYTDGEWRMGPPPPLLYIQNAQNEAGNSTMLPETMSSFQPPQLPLPQRRGMEIGCPLGPSVRGGYGTSDSPEWLRHSKILQARVLSMPQGTSRISKPRRCSDTARCAWIAP
jgi:hypothetical protein